MSRSSDPTRLPGPVRFRFVSGAAGLALLLALSACAGRAGKFRPASPETAAGVPRAWEQAVRRADPDGDANLLYDAAISQGVLSTRGTLAVKLRGPDAEGTLSGPMGAPIATYRDGVLRGEKLQPVRLPPAELRAVLAGVWRGGEPEIAGQRDTEFLLRWSAPEKSEGVFDLSTSELVRLTVRRAEGEIEARFSGPRSPWPERIEIDEKRSGSRLKLRLLARESPS